MSNSPSLQILSSMQLVSPFVNSGTICDLEVNVKMALVLQHLPKYLASLLRQACLESSPNNFDG